MTPELVVHDLFFALFAGLAVVSSIFCVVSKNIVRAAFALMVTFGSVAGLYGVLGADFLMAVQLIVYVGGILILILFAIMLTPHATTAELPGSMPSGVAMVGGVVAVVALLGAFAQLVIATDWACTNGDCQTALAMVPTTGAIGALLLGDYLLPFEVVSVLLLAALVGAVVLTRREVRG